MVVQGYRVNSRIQKAVFKVFKQRFDDASVTRKSSYAELAKLSNYNGTKRFIDT